MTTYYPPITRTRRLTWFAIGATTALVVATLATRRGRHGVGDKMIDAGIWLQTDEGVRLVERSLRAWGGEERRGRERGRHEQEQLQGRNGCGLQNGHRGRGTAADDDRP